MIEKLINKNSNSEMITSNESCHAPKIANQIVDAIAYCLEGLSNKTLIIFTFTS